MTPEWLSGSMVALVTPFSGDKVDEKALKALIERQIAGGTKALVIAGTTGEAATMTEEEHIGVIGMSVDIAAGRIPVIAGVGANVTRDAITLAKESLRVGAQALMATTGYYNKPSRAGLLAHYTKLAEATDLPLIVYNVPSRTASDLKEDLIAELSRLPTVVALKDASGDLARMARHRITCPEDMVFLSGEDITAVGFNAMGGKGCISVSANVAPAHCARMQDACLRGDYAEALKIQDQLTPLHDAMFSDASPAPAKYALAKLGLLEEELRLPLVPANEKARRLVDEALATLDL
ncbi:4-hydroxy-tetrahydrodipicolinate synthase [Parvularcula lutaonensis]|uniref:4-hydroxy-tetrahydrodipicolinate synthase n=1 Tax=Parvularcula lutaonensis TaxID=491923 RepID=A0ABV7MEU6_9PROT|nr:4-hydroxy-tetrahydrodipicolinate synthase [Parvularcula lutaonensis]GGY51446.1 4-hydroxy-tetrahydrodipicolinate synthase [Parvularcula lutaonensis]